MRARGVAGEIRIAGRVAARLGPWECVSLEGSAPAVRWVCTAQALSRDGYWLSQRPLELRLAVGPRTWRWRGVAVADGDQITIQGQGAPEVL